MSLNRILHSHFWQWRPHHQYSPGHTPSSCVRTSSTWNPPLHAMLIFKVRITLVVSVYDHHFPLLFTLANTVKVMSSLRQASVKVGVNGNRTVVTIACLDYWLNKSALADKHSYTYLSTHWNKERNYSKNCQWIIFKNNISNNNIISIKRCSAVLSPSWLEASCQ